MEKVLRNSPTYAVMVALIIQVTRVSDFGTRIGAGWLAWVYAFFLALTIYALSYWVGRLVYDVTATPEEKARHSQQLRMKKLFDRARFNAQVWLALFILIDGGLNLAETMAALPKGVTFWEYTGAGVYGIFPTLAALGLGSLQAHIDKVPAGPSKASFISRLVDKLLARLDTSDKQESQCNNQGQQAGTKDNKQVPSKEDSLLGASDKQDPQVGDKEILTDEALLAYWDKHPQASDGQVAKHFGRSPQAIQQRRKKLIGRGAFYAKAEETVQA